MAETDAEKALREAAVQAARDRAAAKEGKDRVQEKLDKSDGEK